MPTKKMEHDVISALIDRYGDKYDYSELKYINARTPLAIKCFDHGKFYATADSLLSKRRKRAACPKCSIQQASTEKRMNLEEFIERAKSEVSEKLDYSKVELNKATDKVTIICSLHGKFEVVATTFLHKKTGCPSCSLKKRDEKKRLSELDFSIRVNELHGKKYQYDFSEYKNQHSVLNVICAKHGNFKITASNFLNGSGCKACGTETSSNKRRLTTKEWIVKAKSVHGDKYDYSKSRYVTAHHHIIITCSKHGDFKQKASNHIHLKRGCRKCSGISKINNNKQKILTQKEFLRRCMQVHDGSLLNFKKSKYSGVRNKVVVYCKLHGEQSITAGNLMRGAGCVHCAIEKNSDAKRTSISEFVKRASSHYEINYDYSQVTFKNLHQKITVICPIHGAWRVIAANHVIGKSGCPTCRSIEFAENAKKFNTLSTEDFIELSVKSHGLKYDYRNTHYFPYITEHFPARNEKNGRLNLYICKLCTSLLATFTPFTPNPETYGIYH